MAGVHSCTAAPTTSTATAPFAPARASPPGPAARASHSRRRAAERGRSAAAVALGVGSPRHLSAGSLPVPGTQSLSLMVIRGAPRSPDGGETKGRWPGSPPSHGSLEAHGLSQVCPRQDCVAAGTPGRVTARSLAVRTRALPCALAGGWPGRTGGNSSGAGGDAGHHPCARPSWLVGRSRSLSRRGSRAVATLRPEKPVFSVQL